MPRSAAIALLPLLFVAHTYAQRVFYTSQDIDLPRSKQAIRNVRPNWVLSSKITVLYRDGHKEKISRQAIWGYEDRWKRIYRYYKRGFYQLVDAGNVVKYRQKHVNPNGPVQYTYFSKTLDSNIRGTKRRARRDEVNAE